MGPLAVSPTSPQQLGPHTGTKLDTMCVSVNNTLENRSTFDAHSDRVAPHDPEDSAIAGVRIGQIAALSGSGVPLVAFPGNLAGSPVAARSTVRIGPTDLQRSVVLMFEEGSPRRPVVIGLLDEVPGRPDESSPSAKHRERRDQNAVQSVESVSVEADGERLVVSAKQELVLRCGEASITLTKAGKILLRGAYLLSRSSGVNRIKGGSVQIN